MILTLTLFDTRHSTLDTLTQQQSISETCNLYKSLLEYSFVDRYFYRGSKLPGVFENVHTYVCVHTQTIP